MRKRGKLKIHLCLAGYCWVYQNLGEPNENLAKSCYLEDVRDTLSPSPTGSDSLFFWVPSVSVGVSGTCIRGSAEQEERHLVQVRQKWQHQVTPVSSRSKPIAVAKMLCSGQRVHGCGALAVGVHGDSMWILVTTVIRYVWIFIEMLLKLWTNVLELKYILGHLIIFFIVLP